MAIYSKRKLLRGILGTVIVIFGVCALLIKGFDLKLAILTFIVLTFALNDLIKCSSKSALIEENDERNQLVSQKSKSSSFKICQNILIAFVLIFVLIYSFYPSDLILGILLSSALTVFISFITELITSIYFESKM